MTGHLPSLSLLPVLQGKDSTAPANLECTPEHVRVKAKLTPGSTAWFINLHAKGLVASSGHFESTKQ